MFSVFSQKLAIATVCLSLTACATFERAKPAPAVGGPIAVKMNSAELSSWSDLPLGAYKIPESDVIVSGHQRANVAPLLFGVVGVGIAHAANSNSSAAGVSNTEQILRIKLTDQTRSEIESTVSQEPLVAKFSEQSAVAQLDVSPALLLSYVSDTDVRPYVILKAVLGSAGKPGVWETRYFAATGEAKPLEGPQSWTADDGKALKSVVAANLRQAVNVMLRDVAEPYVRDDADMTIVEGDFPYLKQRVQMLGYKLTEDEKYIAFVPKIGDVMTLSGVNVLDKSTVVVRPARPGDVSFKVVQ